MIVLFLTQKLKGNLSGLEMRVVSCFNVLQGRRQVLYCKLTLGFKSYWKLASLLYVVLLFLKLADYKGSNKTILAG